MKKRLRERLGDLFNLQHRLTDQVEVMPGARSTEIDVGIFQVLPLIFSLTIPARFNRHDKAPILKSWTEYIKTAAIKNRNLFSIHFI